MSNKPGRIKGSRLTTCVCGQRMAALPGIRKECASCGKTVTVKAEKGGPKKKPIFIRKTPTKSKR